MKQNHHQVARQSSRPSAAPQPKTAHSKAGARPASASPCIALFLEGDGAGGGNGGVSEEIIDLSKAEYAALKRAAAPSGSGILMFMASAALEKVGWPGGAGHQPATAGDTPSCLCFFDAGVGELAGEIPLVGRELYSVVIAASRQRVTVDQFIADAIREKLGREPGASTSNPMQASGKSTRMGAHIQLEDAVYKSVALLKLLATETSKNDQAAPESVWGTFGAGLVHLAHTVSCELNDAFNLSWKEYAELHRLARPTDQRRAA